MEQTTLVDNWNHVNQEKEDEVKNLLAAIVLLDEYEFELFKKELKKETIIKIIIYKKQHDLLFWEEEIFVHFSISGNVIVSTSSGIKHGYDVILKYLHSLIEGEVVE